MIDMQANEYNSILREEKQAIKIQKQNNYHIQSQMLRIVPSF